MSLLTVCPIGAAIGDVVVDECPVDIGQIQRGIIQRIYSTGTTKNTVTPANAALLATWTALLAAVAGTKAQITPFLSNPNTEPGGPISFGSGNEVIDGIPEVVGTDPTTFTSVLRKISAETKTSLKTLYGEKIGVYLIDEHGRIWGKADDPGTPTALYPIPIRQYFVGDRKIGGKVAPDENAFNWVFEPGWDDDIVSVTPSDFDALTDLSN